MQQTHIQLCRFALFFSISFAWSSQPGTRPAIAEDQPKKGRGTGGSRSAVVDGPPGLLAASNFRSADPGCLVSTQVQDDDHDDHADDDADTELSSGAAVVLHEHCGYFPDDAYLTVQCKLR